MFLTMLVAVVFVLKVFGSHHYSKKWREKNLTPTGCKACDGYGYLAYPSIFPAVYCHCFFEPKSMITGEQWRQLLGIEKKN
jgi:hypothetical protein